MFVFASADFLNADGKNLFRNGAYNCYHISCKLAHTDIFVNVGFFME